jgi:hypothetical protein
MAPSVTVTVRDALTNALVDSPAFTVNGNTVIVGCAAYELFDAGVDADADATGDAGAPRCEQWRVSLPVGHSTLGVSAPGYQPQSFAYDTQMSAGCCATGTQLTQSVALTQ